MLRAISFLLALTATGTAKSQPPSDPDRGLTFDEALASVAEHPQVRAPLEAAGVFDRPLRVGPNGFASLNVRAGYTVAGGERSFQGHIAPGYTFILLRLAHASRDYIRTRMRLLNAEARAALLEHRLEVARAWLALYSAEALTAHLEEEAQLLAEWHSALERALRRGLVTSDELVRLEIKTAELALRQRRQASELVAARRTLAGSLARPDEGSNLRTEGEPPKGEPPERVDVAAAAAALPAIELAQRRREEIEADRLFDLATAWPGILNVSAQVPLDSKGLAGILTIQPPMTTSYQARRSRHNSNIARAALAEERAQREAEQLIATATEEVQTTRPALRVMREQTIPTYEALVDVEHRRRIAGEATIFDELASRRRLLEARVREEELAASTRWARIRLGLLLEAAGSAPAPSTGASPTRPATNEGAR